MPETKLLQMPSDDELFHMLVDAAQDGAHDNIKRVVKQITGYVGNAKAEIKRLLAFDPTTGVSLNLTIATGDETLARFINVQNFMVKGAAKLLMISVGANTFGQFINKMNQKPGDREITTNTTTKILTMFFQKIGEKYVINETPESIHQKVDALFQ